MSRFILIVSGFCWIGLSLNGSAQSATGMNGSLFTPSAYMHEDKTLAVGASFFHRNFLEYGDYQHNALAGYASLTFLPFVELMFRYTGQLTEISRENGNFPDRMPSARVRFLKETDKLPAIAGGFHDFSSVRGGGARYFASTYLVSSKKWSPGKVPVLIETHLGYGFKAFNAANHDLDGVFGALMIAPIAANWLNLCLEYDSKNVNGGLKMLFWKRLQLLAMLRNMQYLEASIAFRTRVF